MVFALPFYIAITAADAIRNQRTRLSGTDKVWILGLGLAGYYLSSFLDFSGLQYIPAGMERLVLFVYPTIVVFISRYFFDKPVTRNHIIAIGITYLGIGVAFIGKAEMGNAADTVKGVLFVLGSAITYAFYLAGSGDVLPRVGTVRFTGYAMMVSSVAVIIHFSVLGTSDIFNLPMPVYGYTLIMAVFSTVLPSYLISGATNKIGASTVSILGSVGPFLTIFLEVMLLGETVGVFQMAGTALVIAGIVYLSRKQSGK